MRKFRFDDEAVFIQKGTVVRFPEGNNIIFGQDFTWWSGLPHDRDFWVHDVLESDGRPDILVLKADGYGVIMEEANKRGLNPDKSYGNGAVYIYLDKRYLDWGSNLQEFLDRCMKEKTNEKENEKE